MRYQHVGCAGAQETVGERALFFLARRADLSPLQPAQPAPSSLITAVALPTRLAIVPRYARCSLFITRSAPSVSSAGISSAARRTAAWISVSSPAGARFST